MSTAKSDLIKKRKCTTPVFRSAFADVFRARAFKDQTPKFAVTMLFDRDTDLSALRKAVFAAKVEKWGKDKDSWPKNLRSPFRDGNEMKDYDGFSGKVFVRASSKTPPGLIDKDKNEITEDTGEFYSGCYARATLIAFAYDESGNKGVSFALQNIQKYKDGKKFSGKPAATDDFDSMEVEDDDGDDVGGDDDDALSLD